MNKSDIDRIIKAKQIVTETHESEIKDSLAISIQGLCKDHHRRQNSTDTSTQNQQRDNELNKEIKQLHL